MSVYLNYKYVVTNRLPVTETNVTGNSRASLCVESQFYKRLSFVLLFEGQSILKRFPTTLYFFYKIRSYMFSF
jgi:hypothetical protein